MGAPPRVSAIIPTWGRPDLVVRAVRSALGQTLRELEAIVVVDGGDAVTERALAGLFDERLRVVVPPRHLGNADARNTGLAHARADWIAFLDDDDEWLPAKLEVQLAAAESSSQRWPIVTCAMIARSETQEFVWPRRAPRPGEPLSEYFFCRRTPFTGEGMVINSAVLAPRELLERVPFRSGLERHVDPDWLLRAAAAGAVLELVRHPEPLVVWHVETNRSRITNRRDWRYSLAWASENRTLFTRRGYAAFLLHVVSASAAAQRAAGAFPRLLAEAAWHGKPAAVDVASHVANFLLPRPVQRGLAGAYARFARPQ
jgi:glycosyltransferase involved in cell wall biosynthesis